MQLILLQKKLKKNKIKYTPNEYELTSYTFILYNCKQWKKTKQVFLQINIFQLFYILLILFHDKRKNKNNPVYKYICRSNNTIQKLHATYRKIRGKGMTLVVACCKERK